MNWTYGPTPTDPDPGKRWHVDCGGEVLWIEDGDICECGAQDQWETEMITHNARRSFDYATCICGWQASSNDYAALQAETDRHNLEHIGQTMEIQVGLVDG